MKSLGLPDQSSPINSLNNVVPSAVPSDLHSSAPLLPLLAEKYI